MKRKGFKFKLITAVVLATALLASVSALLSGCSFIADIFDRSITFTRSELELTVGDTYNVASIIRSSSGVYEVESLSPAVVSVSGTTLTAKKEGYAVVTAYNGYSSSRASLYVTVTAKDALGIEYTGELVQTVTAATPIEFRPVAEGNVASGAIKWYVDGEQVSELSSSLYFMYTPRTPGEHTVKAVSAANAGCFAEEKVRAYYPVTASGVANGQYDQDEEPFLPINLSVDIKRNQHNPDDIIVWTEDGEAVYSGTDTRFVYRPKVGTHTVKLFVNGVQRTINGEQYLTVICRGSIVPGEIDVTFDNVYPHVYLTYESAGKVGVEITSPDGVVREYMQTDARYGALFGDGSFDIGSLISLCASGSTTRNYRFRVKSLGDGGAIKESAYSGYYTFTQLPFAAKAYLENKYLDRDHYLTSDAEYVNMFEYYVINRAKKSGKVKVEFDAYIGYEMQYGADELWDYAFEIAATSGSYSGIGAEINKGNRSLLHTEFSVDTMNTPSKQTYAQGSSGKYTKQLHSNIPHINYDSSAYRPQSYKFYIDGLKNTAEVRYSDELYYVAENNTRPLPVSGSPAETVYRLARDVLRKIVTDDMTDMQKAHAIYDWIMWQVSYDTPATKINKDGEAYSAYYLEGVFGDGTTQIGGVTYYPFAVCDGMSKAYSLLCNMEGIECKRVSGLAGEMTDSKNAGGHAWNKVRIDGEWYLVDCTWGDAVAELDINGVKADYELGMHDWLFVTDDYANTTHFEPYYYKTINSGWEECRINYFPATAKKGLSVYKDWVYNGVSINCEIAAGEDELQRLREIATQFSKAYVRRESIVVPGFKTGEYALDYESIELHFSAGTKLTSAQISSQIKSAIRALRRNASCEVYSNGDVVLVLLRDK